MLPGCGLRKTEECNNAKGNYTIGKKNAKFERMVSATVVSFHEKNAQDMKGIMGSAMTTFSETHKDVETDANNMLIALDRGKRRKYKLERELEMSSVEESPNKKRVFQKLDKNGFGGRT